MTHRIYYDDPFSREFEATVQRAGVHEGRPAVWLDRSAFYPSSGGQPFDTGTLGPARVEEVVEDENGDVVHLLATNAVSELRQGERVAGAIDWPRRFDHMQQHTGQHVLSAAFDRLYGVRTVSFHMGAETSTIDLARETSPAEIARAEDEANRVVWEDRPVAIRYADAEEAARMPLRKESQRGGTLRLIEVEGFDLSACGGTHVNRTGSIGIIAVIAWERFKGGQRLEFVCGGRALARMRLLRETTTASLRLLSVLPSELPAAIERQQAELKQQKRDVAALQSELARYRAEALMRGAESDPRARLVFASVDADANALRALATTVTAAPGYLVVLASVASPCLVVVARSKDVTIASDGIVKSLTGAFGGRGGGRPDLAQAGGLEASAEDVLAAGRRCIE